MNVGKSLKMALAKRGINQTQMAARLNCTVVWVNRIANSRSVSMSTVEGLCEALEMKVSEFLALGED